MERQTLATKLLRIASSILDGSHQRKAYGIVRNPKKVIQNMKDKGFAMNFDGSLWTYPITGIGVPNYASPPQLYAKSADSAERKTGQIMAGYKDKADAFKNSLDDLTGLRNTLISTTPNEDGIDDATREFNDDVKKYINTRARDPQLKALNTDLQAVIAKIEDGEFISAVTNLDEARTNIEENLQPKWKNIYAFFKAQRKEIIEIKRMLEKNKDAIVEIATLGSPPDSPATGDANSDVPMVGDGDITPGPTTHLRAGAGLKREIQSLIKSKGTAKFTYMKEDGQVRKVELAPRGLMKAKDGSPMVSGYDVDRKAERKFKLSGIQ